MLDVSISLDSVGQRNVIVIPSNNLSALHFTLAIQFSQFKGILSVYIIENVPATIIRTNRYISYIWQVTI